ncbi:MAG: phasin family protein [Burkholderiaceae bacterium]|nr:phasin family protein [Burkholderiaceae bacterium]
MVKKLQKMAAKKKAASTSAFGGALPTGLLDSQLSLVIKDSAQQIWAAGLGAFAKAQGEGGKVFDTLVKEGMNLQKKTQSAAEGKLSAVASKMSGMAGDVGAKAGQHWDKLESIFEDRVARAMSRLGVPSAKDIEALIARIDSLSEAVGTPVAKKPAARKAASAKPATKTAAGKPAAKAAAKPAPKKTAVKAAVKPAAKSPAKPAATNGAAKAAAKPARKVGAKTSASADVPATGAGPSISAT